VKDYKAIWNNLSTTFADASFYVCCIGDEDEIRRNGATTAEFLRQALVIDPTDKVLEIGCGVARIGRELAPHCAEWHGADISGNMIAYARERTADIPSVFLHELPDNSLRIFPDDSFDCVYSTIVFMHLDKLEMFTYIAEAYRVLKPGGRAYFDTYNVLAPEGWEEFLKVLRSFPPGSRPGHVSQFSTPQELHKFMDAAGFAQVRIDDQNRQLVLALGVKPVAPNGEAPRPLAEFWAEAAAADLALQSSARPTAQDAATSVAAVLAAQTATADYVARLEAEVARKNAAIADLERRVRVREAQLVAARRPRLPWRRAKSRR